MSVTITATARATVSSFTTVHSNQDIMPWGVMKGTYTPGQPYQIYTDNSSSNNGALSLPYVNNANCPVPNGANPYRDEIDGTLNACPVSVGEQLDVKPGQNAGPTRQGIDTRITSWKPLDQIVQMSANGQATVIDPTSKQLVLIPIVEDPNGATNWLNGAGWVRVVGFAWFVITGPPATPTTARPSPASSLASMTSPPPATRRAPTTPTTTPTTRSVSLNRPVFG